MFYLCNHITIGNSNVKILEDEKRMILQTCSKGKYWNFKLMEKDICDNVYVRWYSESNPVYIIKCWFSNQWIPGQMLKWRFLFKSGCNFAQWEGYYNHTIPK